MSNTRKPVALAVSATLAGGLLLSGSAFASTPLAQGYLLGGSAAAAESKPAQGSCGGDKQHAQGNCGGDKKPAQGSCGGDKQHAQGSCGGKQGAEGKCGEGKCGMAKMDTDKDGKISRAEFNAAHDRMFADRDKNKDGFITADEMKAHPEGKCGEGKCGEGKCGGDKMPKAAEGKCGEGNCGGMI